jgi:fluoride exporter
MDLPLPFWIALGAVPGALCRYYLTLACAQRWGSRLPWGTFWVNLSGSCLIGLGATILQSISRAEVLSAALVVGFLGAYTTFSTYALDTVNLLRQKRPIAALLYGLGSPISGLLGVALGIALAQQLW